MHKLIDLAKTSAGSSPAAPLPFWSIAFPAGSHTTGPISSVYHAGAACESNSIVKSAPAPETAVTMSTGSPPVSSIVTSATVNDAGSICSVKRTVRDKSVPSADTLSATTAGPRVSISTSTELAAVSPAAGVNVATTWCVPSASGPEAANVYVPAFATVSDSAGTPGSSKSSSITPAALTVT